MYEINHPPIPHYHLQGDVENNFYNLGLKDKILYEKTFNELQSLLKVRFWPVDQFFSIINSFITQKISRSNLLFEKELTAYSEGLGRPLLHLLSGFLLPEIITSIHQVMPKIPLMPFGCSSLFHYNSSEGNIYHGRILDFPVYRYYNESERTVVYQFEGLPKIWSLSLTGIPLPSVTAMNSEGLTLALHIKHGKAFNLNGHFIFEIVYKLLQECQTTQDVLDLLKDFPALSSWGLYITTKEGKALSVDIYGENFFYEEKDLKEEPLLYVNNLPIREELEGSFNTEGFRCFCNMRKRAITQKIEKKKEKKKELSAIDMLELLGRPDPMKATQSKKWAMDVVTITTMHTAVMNAVKGEVYLIPGPVPKILHDKVLKIDRIWDLQLPRYQELESKLKPYRQDFTDGFHLLAESTADYKEGKIDLAIEHINQAAKLLAPFADGIIAQFYSLVYQFIHEAEILQRTKQLAEFKNIRSQLPPYLRDHCVLFIFRLERFLYQKSDITEDEIETDALKNLYRIESKIPTFLLKKMTKLIAPQIATSDIFYAYYLT